MKLFIGRLCWVRKKFRIRHAGLDPASRISWNYWIPAFAGMTLQRNFGFLPHHQVSFSIRLAGFLARGHAEP
jgi:hypothetical protein